jgi:hypothetical protein
VQGVVPSPIWPDLPQLSFLPDETCSQSESSAVSTVHCRIPQRHLSSDGMPGGAQWHAQVLVSRRNMSAASRPSTPPWGYMVTAG